MSTIEDVLRKENYQSWDEGFSHVYYREDESVVYAVNITRLSGKDLLTVYDYQRMNAGIIDHFTSQMYKKTEVLNIIVMNDSLDEEIRELVEQVSGVWVIKERELRLFVFENQPIDFDGLYIKFTEYLNEIRTSLSSNSGFPITAPITIGLILINVLVYIYLNSQGDVYDAGFMFDHGALIWQSVVFGNQYYRLFTSMFMHFGIAHLLNNMFILGIMGDQLEKSIGKIRFLILYFGAGIAASITSTLFHMWSDSLVVSAGASGAIYGVIGGLAITMIGDPRRRRKVSIPRLLFLAAGTIYLAFTESGVDHWAHLGGFVSGFLICAVFLLVKHLRGKRN